MRVETAFVLAYRPIVNHAYLGVLCRELEKSGLTIIGIKFMSVNSDFAELYIRRPGRVDLESPKDWVKYLSECPMAILLLKGENAVKVARQVTSSQWLLEWGRRPRYIGGHCYCSPTPEIAEEDIEMWFDDDHDEWSEKCLDKELVYVFRDKVCGDLEKAPFCYRYLGYKCYEDLYYQNQLVFILIRPAAVQHRLVGQIINAFERISYDQLRGLRRVNMKQLPEDIAWSCDSSSSETAINVDDDDVSSFGVAVVFERLEIEGKVIFTENGDNRCFFNPRKFTLEIDRNLIYISKPGQEAWELITRCFPFGFVIRPKINCIAILEASLTGLFSD